MRADSPILCVLIFAAIAGTAGAEDLLPPDREASDVIDHYVRQKWIEDGIEPANSATASQLHRRTTLDLAGRIPTAAERTWFTALPENERQAALVRRLLKLPDFSRRSVGSLPLRLMPMCLFQSSQES